MTERDYLEGVDVYKDSVTLFSTYWDSSIRFDLKYSREFDCLIVVVNHEILGAIGQMDKTKLINCLNNIGKSGENGFPYSVLFDQMKNERAET